MDKKELKELIDFMNEHKLSELEIEEEGKRVKLKKNSANSPVLIKENIIPQAAQENKEQHTDKNTIEIKSPMVGTFYRAPSPGAKPYVDVGDEIKPGDILCIIEAMKLMNEIKSDVSGKVTKILTENAEPVEFGQTLFVIEPL